MTSTRPDSNRGIFQNSTLVYGPTPPDYAVFSIPSLTFLSESEHTDKQSGEQFRYYFYCVFGAYLLGRLYPKSVRANGGPYWDGNRYSWLIGPSGNSCSPFLLSDGNIFPGGDPSCVVVLSQ